LLVQTYFRGNDFAAIKIFEQKIFGSIPFPGKLFCNNKNFRPIKNVMKMFGSILFPSKRICNNKNFRPKTLDENIWFKPIPEEMILQP